MEVIDRRPSTPHRPLQPTRHRLSVDDYLLMHEIGLFGPDPHVELVDGEVYDMATIGTRHASTVMRLNRLLTSAVGATAIVSVQSPVRLGDRSMPQPDLMLLRPRDDFYARVHPTAADVPLLIEVADSSARHDCEIKLPVCAREGVGEVWIIDLDARVARFHRVPQGDVFDEVAQSDAPGIVPVAAVPGLSIDLTGVLG